MYLSYIIILINTSSYIAYDVQMSLNFIELRPTNLKISKGYVLQQRETCTNDSWCLDRQDLISILSFCAVPLLYFVLTVRKENKTNLKLLISLPQNQPVPWYVMLSLGHNES